MRQRKRSRLDIYAEIINSINAFGGSARLTRLSYAANVPVDRAKSYLEDLIKVGLVKPESIGDSTFYVMTPKGYEFIQAYMMVRVLIELEKEGN